MNLKRQKYKSYVRFKIPRNVEKEKNKNWCFFSSFDTQNPTI
jgi:hypothetical protein